jgi:hypothetical protein
VKLAPSGLGAEPKKLALLGVLVVVGIGIYWFQNRSDSPTVSASVAPSPAAIPAIKTFPEKGVPEKDTPASPPRRPSTPGGGGMDDFRPTMKVKDDLDVSKIDPRIRLDLLAKVRAVPLEGGTSSLFEYSKAPEAPTPKVDPIKPVPLPPPAPSASTVSATKGAAKETGPPPPPPIPFKYYGYLGKATDGLGLAFFREGDPNTGDIFLAQEGDTIKNRYKIIRVGIKSAVVEDTTNHNQQTLGLLEEAQ